MVEILNKWCQVVEVMPSVSWFATCIQQASENLGMAMIYTLVTSAKEWLSERFEQDSTIENAKAEEAAKDEVDVL